jgi:hypothetical protein
MHGMEWDHLQHSDHVNRAMNKSIASMVTNE